MKSASVRHLFLLGLVWPLIFNLSPLLSALYILIPNLFFTVLYFFVNLAMHVLAYLGVARLYPQPPRIINRALMITLGLGYVLSYATSEPVMGRYWRLTEHAPQVDLQLDEFQGGGGLGYYHFQNGRLLPDSIHEEVITSVDADGNSETTYFWVAPIVSENWHESEPVTVWAVSTRNARFLAEWEGNIQGFGQRVSTYETAVSRAISNNNWPSNPNSPLILDLQTRNYNQLLNATTRNLRWVYLVLNLLAFVPLTIYLRSRGSQSALP